MDRRTFLAVLAVLGTPLAVGVAASPAQDLEYLAALERAQRDRPGALHRQDAANAGRFGTIRPVEETAGVQHVTLDIRLNGRDR